MFNTQELTDEITYIILDRINRLYTHPESFDQKHNDIILYDENNHKRFSTQLAYQLEKLGYITNTTYADGDLYIVKITQKGYDYLNQYKHN